MTRPYRVGVIGSTGRGGYGHRLDDCWLAEPRTEIVAVADDNKAGLAHATKRLGVDRGYTDYRKMIEETNPDIVAICPRWVDQHRDMALAAAERGIHIYMEKPFCPSLDQADEIVAACQQTHAKLAIAHPTRYSPKIATIKKLIADGAIGEVLEYRGRGKEDHRGGGEDLWVLGTHVMDMIRAIGGHPQWCFAIVSEEGDPVTAKNVVDGNEGLGPLAGDAIQAMYGMPDGSTAYFATHRKAGGNPSRYGLQIVGSKGILELLEGPLPPVKYLGDPSWSPGRSGAEWQNVSSAGIGEEEPLTDPLYRSRHGLAIRDLLAAIEEEREPIGGMEEARGATEMIVAVFESQRRGRPVDLPLKNRKHPLSMLG
ncbi:putative oxidoreductase YdgJ [Planctomycetes bacterium Pan216]|uniref:Putative oxidoreductase YdgJ n=1 Tax=Kolteria novifilia TaxID=2527975 RepID=A0A518B8X3_9BACT|nr:putative oxidoreductase YdgJ [Planctomycetes bacterium Pan216]